MASDIPDRAGTHPVPLVTISDGEAIVPTDRSRLEISPRVEPWSRKSLSPGGTPTHIRFNDQGHPDRYICSRGSESYTPSSSSSLNTPNRNRNGSTPSDSLLATPSTPAAVTFDQGLRSPPRHRGTLPGANPFPTPDSMNHTPGLSSSPPERLSIRFITPETPTQHRVRFDGRDLSYTQISARAPSAVKQAKVVQRYQVWDNQIATAGLHRTPTKSVTFKPVLPGPTLVIQIPEAEVLPAQPTPKLLHHVSSDGGPVAALERYIKAKHLDPRLSGMSLFLHCPKRRIALFSSEELEKERRCAREWHQLMRMSGQDGVGSNIVHAVHTMNLGSRDSGIRLRSFLSLRAEMRFARSLGIDVLVFHPGSTGYEDDNESDLFHLASDIQLLLDQVPDITLAIENATHRCRGQLGRSLRDLEYLVKRVGPRLKVCLDICHLHVDQYDLSTPSGRDDLFLDLARLGWDKIAAIHVSDSREKHGGNRDLHAGGQIGLDDMRAILHHPNLLGKVPYLLETPKYLPQHRTIRRRCKPIQELDEQLSRLERECLRELLEFESEDWEDQEIRQRWWLARRRLERDVRRQIGRMIRKAVRLEDNDSWKEEKKRERSVRSNTSPTRTIGSRKWGRADTRSNSQRKMHD